MLQEEMGESENAKDASSENQPDKASLETPYNTVLFAERQVNTRQSSVYPINGQDTTQERNETKAKKRRCFGVCSIF